MFLPQSGALPPFPAEPVPAPHFAPPPRPPPAGLRPRAPVAPALRRPPPPCSRGPGPSPASPPLRGVPGAGRYSSHGPGPSPASPLHPLRLSAPPPCPRDRCPSPAALAGRRRQKHCEAYSPSDMGAAGRGAIACLAAHRGASLSAGRHRRPGKPCEECAPCRPAPRQRMRRPSSPPSARRPEHMPRPPVRPTIILLLGRHGGGAMVLVWIGIAIGVIIAVVLVRKLLTTHPYDAVSVDRHCRTCGRPTHGLKCPHCDGDKFGR